MEQPYNNSYGTLIISKLKDLVKDLTFSLNLGRCDYALTMRHRGNKKNYIVPNEETYLEIRKRVVQNPTDFAILRPYFNLSHIHCLDTLHHLVSVANNESIQIAWSHFLVQFQPKKEMTQYLTSD